MLHVIRNGHWHSAWPVKDVTLRHIRAFYTLLGYTSRMEKDKLHITKR